MQTDLNLFGIDANLAPMYRVSEHPQTAQIRQFQQGQIKHNKILCKTDKPNINRILQTGQGPNVPYGNEIKPTKHLVESTDAWDAIKSLIGTIEGPTDWASQHDHYLYGTPRQS
jgi:hypothetical protein